MKELVKLLVCIFALQTPALVHGSQWDNFLDIKNKYYYLEGQKFNEISCKVDMPLLTYLVQNIKNDLQSLHEVVEITDNLSKFTMTYSQGSNLKFIRPEFDIKIIKEEGLADPEKVKKGKKMMENGFNSQVNTITNILNSLFGEYSYPKKEQNNNINIKNNDGTYSVNYIKEGSETFEIYSGNTIEGSQKFSDGNLSYNMKYETESSGKLLINQWIISINNNVGNIKTDSYIFYQNIGGIIFPKQIKVNSEYELESMKQHGKYEINLSNCTIN